MRFFINGARIFQPHTHRHHHAASLRTRVSPLRHTPCPCPRRSLRSMPGNRIVAAAAACSLSTLGCFYFTVKQLEQGRPTLKTARNSAHQQHGQRCVCAGCESMDGVATQAARPMACTVTTLPGCPSLPNSYIPISTSDSDGASSDTKEDGDNGTSVSDDNASDGHNVVVVFGDLPRPVAYNTLVMYDPKLFN